MTTKSLDLCIGQLEGITERKWWDACTPAVLDGYGAVAQAAEERGHVVQAARLRALVLVARTQAEDESKCVPTPQGESEGPETSWVGVSDAPRAEERSASRTRRGLLDLEDLAKKRRRRRSKASMEDLAELAVGLVGRVLEGIPDEDAEEPQIDWDWLESTFGIDRTTGGSIAFEPEDSQDPGRVNAIVYDHEGVARHGLKTFVRSPTHTIVRGKK